MDTMIQPQVNPKQPPRPAAPRRRRGRGWVLLVLALAVLAVFAAAGYLYLDQLALQRVEVDSLSSAGDGPTNFLIVGSDSRENLPDDLEGSFGNFAGQRSDVMILAHVVGNRRQLLSIPRDLKVDIPGEGTNRINAAYALGGPDLLVEAVAAETGIPIHHYLEVEFGGFAAIVDAIGGIELDFPHPARDEKSGLLVEEAGRQRVDGATALAYARSRSYEELIDGEWVAQTGGDIARTGRQREVLLQILAKTSTPSVLVRTPGLIAAVSGNLTADTGLSMWDLLRTGWGMRSAKATDAASLPVVGASEGGVAYLVRDEPAAGEMLQRFERGRRLEPAQS
jgi:LCP family protein required for cell wall assembly